jgi:hypothetical protein
MMIQENPVILVIEQYKAIPVNLNIENKSIPGRTPVIRTSR